MKGLKTTLVSAIAAGLLVGSAVGVTAQDDAAGDEATGPAYFTGTILREGTWVVDGEENVVDGTLEARGAVVEGEPIETTDPRMTGTLSRALNANIHKVGDFEDVVIETAAWRIENDGGAWSGQGGALIHGGGGLSQEEATDFDTILLTGEGGYEGLTAYVLADWTEDPVAVEGAVVIGEAPPFPEVPSAPESEAAE